MPSFFFFFLQFFPPSKLPLEQQINTFVPRFLRSDLTNYNHDDIHSPPRTIPSTTKTDLDPKGTAPTESRNVINSSSRLFERAPLYHPLARRSTTTKPPRATSSPRDCARVTHTYIYKAAYAIQWNGTGAAHRVFRGCDDGRLNVGRTGENSVRNSYAASVSFSATTVPVIASSPFFLRIAPSPSSSFYRRARIWKMKKSGMCGGCDPVISWIRCAIKSGGGRGARFESNRAKRRFQHCETSQDSFIL